VQNDERLIRRPNNNGNGINLGVGSIVAVIALRDGAGMRYGHDRVILSGSHRCPLERQKSQSKVFELFGQGRRTVREVRPSTETNNAAGNSWAGRRNGAPKTSKTTSTTAREECSGSRPDFANFRANEVRRLHPKSSRKSGIRHNFTC